jgi:hypothetical protein
MRWALSIPGELILRAGVWLDPGITPCVKELGGRCDTEEDVRAAHGARRSSGPPMAT